MWQTSQGGVLGRGAANSRQHINRRAKMPIGFRIRRNTDKVSTDLVAQFKGMPVANVSDSMSRMTAGGPRLRPVHASGPLSGPALTVKTRPGDNLMLHKAIDMAEPGDIIVCDGGGDLTNSLMGEIMLSQAIERGVGGFVLDGAVRDLDAFQEKNLPVFAVGVSHRGPYKDGPGEIGYAIAIDGMVINPGDLIIGDWDGFLCVPKAEAPAVLAATEAKNAAEVVQLAEIKAGTHDRSWVDASLKRLGCSFED
jgi:regulator of RNase E activity RraA